MDGGEDVGVGGTAAEVAAHAFSDLGVGQFGGVLEVVGDVAGRPALTSSSMPTAEQIWPGVQ